MSFPIFALNKRDSIPLYRQLGDSVSASIINGLLSPGEKLPSTRELAELLGVSRITVVRAYEVLVSEGILQSTRGGGTYITSQPPPAPATYSTQMESFAPSQLSNFGQRLASQHSEDIDDAPAFFPEADLLPTSKWRQSVLSQFRSSDQQVRQSAIAGDKQEAFGYRPLREVICSYLKRTKGLNCHADQVAVFSSEQQAQNLIMRVFLNPKDVSVVENPCSPQLRRALLAEESSLRFISVDSDGAQIDQLETITEPVKSLWLTPSYQNPTGALLSSSRRHQLVTWSRQRNCIVVEQDSNHVLHSGSALLPLQTMDEGGSTFYMSNFNQLLFPLTSIAFVVVPRHYVPMFEQVKARVSGNVQLSEQRILSDFISGNLERVARTTRMTCAKRRQSLLFALTTAFRNRIRVGREVGGLHSFIKIFSQLTDAEILDCASAAGLNIIKAKPFYVDEAASSEFLVPFNQVQPEHAMSVAHAFARRIRELESDKCFVTLENRSSTTTSFEPSISSATDSEEQFLIGKPWTAGGIS